jgi:hypothetical protein
LASSNPQKLGDFGIFPSIGASQQVMGEKAETLGLVAFETLPWACRFNDWGKTATVLGTKERQVTLQKIHGEHL